MIHIVKNYHIDDNNQHSKGGVGNLKQQPDKKMNCAEPTIHLHAKFHERERTCKQFVDDLEQAKDIVAM